MTARDAQLFLEDFITEKSAYDSWVESQDTGRIREYCVNGLRELELRPWSRKGGSGMFLNLFGTEGMNDAYVCEIPPGEALHPDRHLFEELVYVLSGRGATRVWNEGSAASTFEWRAGSLFAIPLNCHYQHFNSSGREPARYMAVTSAPLVINLFRDLDFVFNSPHRFGRFDGDSDYYSESGEVHGKHVWETNFVADVANFPLVPRHTRGGDMTIQLELADGSLAAHISEFPVGRYKNAHRHGPGAHVIIIAGNGYSLMWPDGEEPRRFDWGPGSVLVPPDMWWHQHFNVGSEPARYLALRWGSKKNHLFKRYTGDRSVYEGGNQIGFDAQHPAIHAQFEAALGDVGVVPAMPKVG